MNLEVDDSIEEDILYISDEDAKNLNLVDGDLILLTGQNKSAVVRICIEKVEAGTGSTNFDVFQSLSPFTKDVKISLLREEAPIASIFHVRILLDSVIEVAKNESSLENLLEDYHGFLEGKVFARGQIIRLRSGIKLKVLDWFPKKDVVTKIHDSTDIFIDLGIHSADEIEYRTYQSQMEALKSQKIEKTVDKLLKCIKEVKEITLDEMRDHIESIIEEETDSNIVVTNIEEYRPKRRLILRYPKEKQIIERLMDISSGVDQDF